MVNDTQTSLESHVDSHLVLRDSVHGGRHEGSLESDALGDGGVECYLGGREANVARHQQEVIVRKTAVLGSIHELVDIETIGSLVFLEHIEGGGVVKHLAGAEGVESSHCECNTQMAGGKKRTRSKT